MTRLLVFPQAIAMILTTVVPSQAVLCKKSNGIVLARPACGGKLVPVTAADLAGTETPAAPVLVSAHAEASEISISTVYTVPARQSFTLTDIEFSFPTIGDLTLSDSSGVRLVIVAPLSERAVCGSGGGSRTYSTGLQFAPGSTITMAVSNAPGCGFYGASITIMGRLLPAS